MIATDKGPVKIEPNLPDALTYRDDFVYVSTENILYKKVDSYWVSITPAEVDNINKLIVGG